MLLATECFASGDIEVKENIWTLSLAKDELNAEATLKIYELFVYKDMRSVINKWFCKNVLIVATA